MTDASSVPLIPREVLSGNPEMVAPRLSPDGERLAYLAPKAGVMNPGSAVGWLLTRT